MIVKDQWVPFFQINITDKRFFLSSQHGEGRWFEYKYTQEELGYHDPVSFYYRVFWLDSFETVDGTPVGEKGALKYKDLAKVEIRWRDSLGQDFTNDVFINFVMEPNGRVTKTFSCPNVSESGKPCSNTGRSVFMDFRHKSHWRCYKCIEADIHEALAVNEFFDETSLANDLDFIQIGSRELLSGSPETAKLTWDDIKEASERRKARKTLTKNTKKAKKQAQKSKSETQAKAKREITQKARDILDLGSEIYYSPEDN